MRTLHSAILNNAQPIYIRILAENTKHRQILKTVGMPHRKLHHSDAAILFFSPHNKRFCFAMNNAATVALFGHIV